LLIIIIFIFVCALYHVLFTPKYHLTRLTVTCRQKDYEIREFARMEDYTYSSWVKAHDQNVFSVPSKGAECKCYIKWTKQP